MADARTALIVLLALLAAGPDEPARRRNVLSRLAGRATDAVTDVVDPDLVLDKVDVDAIAQRIDVDALVQRVDVDALVRRVDVDALVRSIDLDQLIKEVDIDALLEQADVNRLLDRVDANRLLDRVDPDRLLDRVDPNRLLDRVDPERLLDRVDPNRLMERVDVDALMARVDVEEVIERAGIPEIVRESTGHMAGSVLDVGRRQVVGVDQLVGRVVYRLTGRDPHLRPTAPEGLIASEVVDEKGRGEVTGHYSGPLSRLAAYILDVGVLLGVYTLITAGVAFIARFVFGFEMDDPLRTGIWAAVAFAGWAFVYDWVGPALTGRTVGKRIVGIRIVQRDGSPLRGSSAFWRAVTRPISIAIFGLGLVGIVLSPERRGLHDAWAKTVVVYDWGERSASMPAPLTAWLARHDVDLPAPEEA